MSKLGCRFCAHALTQHAFSRICWQRSLAQSTGGRIIGRVTDPSGAVIPDATVTITNDATGVSNHTQSNKSGDYSFPTVAVGTYTIEFEATGFKKLTRKQVALDLNQTLTVNGTLELGAATETVEVTSEAPLVDTSSTQLGATVDSLMATQLPLNTRDTYQLLQLQPGVMSNVGGSNSIAYGSDQPGVVSVNGGRGRSNNFNVNGGDANDLFANLPTVQPSPDSIAEFRVLTNTFDAEYGRNSGAVINVVTKSGTNEFHGNAFEFFRNSVLNAQGYFNVVKPAVPAEPVWRDLRRAHQEGPRLLLLLLRGTPDQARHPQRAVLCAQPEPAQRRLQQRNRRLFGPDRQSGGCRSLQQSPRLPGRAWFVRAAFHPR